MRTLHLLLLTVCVAARVHGQGTVNFANLAAGVNAPIYDGDNTTKLTGPSFLVQLWAGPTANSLAPVSPPISFSTLVPGIFLGGSTVVPTVPAGSPAFFQVRAWGDKSKACPPTWDAAMSAWLGGDDWIQIGFNGMDYANLPGNAAFPLQTPPLGGGVLTPPNLISLTSFHLTPGPEPSVIALGVLCGGALLLYRRRR